MGQSTDASICYGIPFDEGTEFPWDDYDDFDDWYLYEVLGYKPSIKLYDDDGEYINGVRPAQNLIDKSARALKAHATRKYLKALEKIN